MSIRLNMEMSYLNFEELLGKSASEINLFLDCDFQQKKLNKVFFDIILKDNFSYYGFNLKFISFVRFENNIINSITIHVNNIINLKFYSLFIKDYGKPKNIIVKAGKKTETIIKENDESKTFKQILKNTFFEDTEGSFEDKPSLIIWSKKNYTIRMVMLYKENVSTITFTEMK